MLFSYEDDYAYSAEIVKCSLCGKGYFVVPDELGRIGLVTPTTLVILWGSSRNVAHGKHDEILSGGIVQRFATRRTFGIFVKLKCKHLLHVGKCMGLFNYVKGL